MILSKETITILQNFQTINPSIVIREGNLLRTRAVAESVLATATVPDEFPRTIPIYDLSKFLSILSLTKDDSEIEFLDTKMIIRQKNGTTNYAYCPENLIKEPEGNSLKMGPTKTTFTLTDETWQQVSRAMSIMKFSEFAFVGENGELSIQALSLRDESSDTYSSVIGETDLNFKVLIDGAKMKLLPADYVVTIGPNCAHFEGPDAQYWLAISVKSIFE
jgi:hypothetical protein